MASAKEDNTSTTVNTPNDNPNLNQMNLPNRGNVFKTTQTASELVDVVEMWLNNIEPMMGTPPQRSETSQTQQPPVSMVFVNPLPVAETLKLGETMLESLEPPAAQAPPPPPPPPPPTATKTTKVDVVKLICVICLCDHNTTSNNIMECKSCGVTVHECCYGVSDNVSLCSTGSISSGFVPPPWFCDPCEVGVVGPDCALCPNKGGIYKKTDIGQWVHLICGLYCHDVIFNNVDELSLLSISHMQSSEWGSKICSLCTKRTGVCIGCHKDECEQYFHVTCAQKHGLLVEVIQPDLLITNTDNGGGDRNGNDETYHAYCELHTEVVRINKRRSNCMTLEMNMREKMKMKIAELIKVDDIINNYYNILEHEPYMEKYMADYRNRTALISALKQEEEDLSMNIAQSFEKLESVNIKLNNLMNEDAAEQPNVLAFKCFLKKLHVVIEMKAAKKENVDLPTTTKDLQSTQLPSQVTNVQTAICVLCQRQDSEDNLLNCDICMHDYHLECLSRAMKQLKKNALRKEHKMAERRITRAMKARKSLNDRCPTHKHILDSI